MRILSKQRCAFTLGRQTFEAPPFAAVDMPDAFAESLMFRLAREAGWVSIPDAPPAAKKKARRAARRRGGEGCADGK